MPGLQVGGDWGQAIGGENLEALVIRFAPDAKEGPIKFDNSGTDLPVKNAFFTLPFEYDRETTPVIRR